MNGKFKEAVELFEEVMIYGMERFMKTSYHSLWSEYSPEQIQVLKILATYKRATSSQLADLQGVHKSAISHRIRRLEEKGLITLETSEQDRRVKVISLTASGKQLVERANEAIQQQFEALILEHIDEEELDQFIDMFRKLKEILQMKGR